MRRGFTLVELLVATGIFVLGFSVCLGLFLAGTRQRTAAEDHLRLGLAASSLVEEIGLGTTPTPYPSSAAAFVVSPPAYSQVPHHPHVWYRVAHCTPAVRTKDDPDGTLSEGWLMTLVVVHFAKPVANAQETLSPDEVQRRVRVPGVSTSISSAAQLDPLEEHLLSRGMALRFETVVLRP